MSSHSGQKCDARRCGSPATVTDRLGGRFCRGHSYLAQAKQAEAFINALPRSMRETAHKGQPKDTT